MVPVFAFTDAVSNARAVARTAGPVPAKVNSVLRRLVVDKMEQHKRDNARAMEFARFFEISVQKIS